MADQKRQYAGVAGKAEGSVAGLWRFLSAILESSFILGNRQGMPLLVAWAEACCKAAS